MSVNFNKEKINRIFRLNNIDSFLSWDDIKEGESYHVPPLIFNGRFDFVVKEKQPNFIRVLKDGSKHTMVLYRTDATRRFITKKIIRHGQT